MLLWDQASDPIYQPEWGSFTIEIGTLSSILWTSTFEDAEASKCCWGVWTYSDIFDDYDEGGLITLLEREEPSRDNGSFGRVEG